MPDMHIVTGIERCASCSDQKPDERHVDFGGAYEGPVVFEGEQPVAIDKLIVCENCLRIASRLLGLEDWADLQEKLAQVTAQRNEAEKQLAAQLAYTQQLEGAISAKPEPKKRQTKRAVAV